MYIALAVALAIALGGGATVASNNSLPGDPLYGLKIGVHEQLETAFAFSDEAKAQEHIEAINERHKEAQKLEAEGKLSAEAKADINANIDAHAKAFAAALASVKANGNAEATTQLEAKLQAALNAAANISAGASVNANANANAHSTATTTDDDGTMDQGHGDAGTQVESNGGVKVNL